ncbi:DsbA family protein [Streptomyces sp. NPDC057939]|uniref:DsbA family protein n=1 Tax=Streptomyces sp. NPDC057939 TaxID=3346284 RepID=UPI0036E64FE4
MHVGAVGAGRSRRGFLALATGLGTAPMLAACGLPSRRQSGSEAVQPLPKAAESLHEDRTTIVIGDANAPVSVRLYEDPSCPGCAEFELRGTGRHLRDKAQKGEIQLQFCLGSFLGPGSVQAVNALRAALDHDAFLEFHEALYRKQTAARKLGGFTPDFLLVAAIGIEGLRGAEFEEAVTSMKYQEFVDLSEEALESAGVSGTPSMAVNGRLVHDDDHGVFDSARTLDRYLAKQPPGQR